MDLKFDKEIKYSILNDIIFYFGSEHSSDMDIIGSFMVEDDKNTENQFYRENMLYNNVFRWYKVLGKILIPNRILSIGVRFGYDSISICKGIFERGVNDIFILGVDNESYMKGSNIIASNNFNRINVKNEVLTSTVENIKTSEKNFDLAIVDGNHTDIGVIKRDLEFAYSTLNKGGWILVDDYDFLEPVKTAVCSFVRGLEFYHIPMPFHQRGLCLIKK